MKTISITVERVDSYVSFRNDDRRSAFWAGVKPRYANDKEITPDIMEARIRNKLPQYLSAALRSSFYPPYISDEYRDERFGQRSRRIVSGQPSDPAHLVVTVLSFRYGSLTIDLGIPDIDAFLEIVGNNGELLAAVFETYIPEAFSQATSLQGDDFTFKAVIPSDVGSYITNADLKKSKSETPKEESIQEQGNVAKGATIMANMLRSPIIFPILLLCFLWYYARQDALADKTLTYNLVQTLVTQQTATIALLKDKPVHVEQDREGVTTKVNSNPVPATERKEK